MASKLSNAEIYHLWRNGRCKCGAPKWEKQPFCWDCYAELSHQTKRRLTQRRGNGYETAFVQALREINGEIQEQI